MGKGAGGAGRAPTQTWAGGRSALSELVAEQQAIRWMVPGGKVGERRARGLLRREYRQQFRTPREAVANAREMRRLGSPAAFAPSGRPMSPQTMLRLFRAPTRRRGG